jgi:hypothetical protein
MGETSLIIFLNLINRGSNTLAKYHFLPHVAKEMEPRPHIARFFGPTNLFTKLVGARSSVGRALEWHSRGQGFDSPRVHFWANIKNER